MSAFWRWSGADPGMSSQRMRSFLSLSALQTVVCAAGAVHSAAHHSSPDLIGWPWVAVDTLVAVFGAYNTVASILILLERR
jgi:hypothetical protein